MFGLCMGYDPYYNGFGRNSWKSFEDTHVMKEELSRKEVTREIWNGFYVCLKYRVELGSKVWKNVRKTHILGTFR